MASWPEGSIREILFLGQHLVFERLQAGGGRHATIPDFLRANQPERRILTRISFWASRPATLIRSLGSIGAVFLFSFIPSDSGSPGTGHPWLLQVRESLEVPHFKRFLRRLSGPSLLRPVWFPFSAALAAML